MKITFRPLKQTDFTLLQKWLNSPHVKEWWKEESDLGSIEKKYGKRVDGNSATTCFVILLENRPIGMIQSYWVKDYKEYNDAIKIPYSVGIDLFIGEDEFIGKGVGRKILSEFCKQIVRSAYSDVQFGVASPSIHNLSSIRAFEKAGFVKGEVLNLPGEEDPEQLMIFELK